MKETKFKIWNKKNRTMSDAKTIQDLAWNGDGYGLSALENFIWLQYTGIKDKQGKEIYEGDVVREEDDKYQVCLGEFQKSNITFIGFYFSPLDENDFIIQSPWEGCEIIGDIYRNPELLKGR